MKYLYNGWHKISEIKAMVKGKLVSREFLHLKSAVGAITTDTLGRVGLVQQYRPTIDKTTLEIPAGVLDKKGLTPLEILIEELDEECNIKSSEIISATPCEVNGFYMITGSSNAYMSLFRIKVEEQPNEVIVEDSTVEKVIWIPFNEFEKLIKEKKIIDNKTILSYYILKGEM